MELKKTAAAVIAAFLMMGTPLGVCADDEEEYFEEPDGYTDEADDSDYITDSEGLYKYSLNDEGTAVIEEYLGNETSVIIPDELDGIKVTGLGDYAYYMHEEITDITVSANILDFEWFPFYGCTSLKEFKVDEDNPLYEADEQGILFDKAGQCLMAYPAALENEEYVIPDGIVCINSSAFACNPYLKKVTIPEGVVAEYMGIRAFAECTALETVVFPESLTAISEFCFAACTSLKNIEFTETLTEIDQAAFFNCTALEQPVFPDSLTTIGQGAFMSTGFDQVEIPPTVISIGYSSFGFRTDEDDNIVQMDKFTIYGYNNTYAQTYCSENGITFVSLDEETEAEEESGEKNSSEEKTVTRNRIIFAVSAVVIAAVIIAVAVINRKSKKLPDEDEGDYDDYEGDNEEETESDGISEGDDDAGRESDGEV